MTVLLVCVAALALCAGLLFLWAFLVGRRWGATAEERARPMAGDEWLAEPPKGGREVVMTRAIEIAAPRQVLWPWLAQLGRGAGFYSYDLLDNGRRASARHIVSWVPEPRLGDASAIGYIRHLHPGQEIAWWMPGMRWLGAFARMMVSYRIDGAGDRSRLIMRVRGDGSGAAALLVLALFTLIDSLMARRQLLGLKERAEACGARTADPRRPETGRKDQFQFFEFVDAAGGSAGTPGKEEAALWREAALKDLGDRMGEPASSASVPSAPPADAPLG